MKRKVKLLPTTNSEQGGSIENLGMLANIVKRKLQGR